VLRFGEKWKRRSINMRTVPDDDSQSNQNKVANGTAGTESVNNATRDVGGGIHVG
jgi:hypothetical protein